MNSNNNSQTSSSHKKERIYLGVFSYVQAKNTILRLLSQNYNFLLLIGAETIEIFQDLPRRENEAKNTITEAAYRNDILEHIQICKQHCSTHPAVLYIMPLPEGRYVALDFDPFPLRTTAAREISSDVQGQIDKFLSSWGYSFSQILAIPGKKLEGIFEALMVTKNKKELKDGYQFVVLTPEFLTPRQQQSYKKLTEEKKREWQQYLHDEHFYQLCLRYGLYYYIQEYNGLPEIVIEWSGDSKKAPKKNTEKSSPPSTS